MTTSFFRHKNTPLGSKNTFSHFLVENMSFWEAYQGSKKGYLAKPTAWKASIGPKLSKYNRAKNFEKIFSLPFFSHFFFRRNPNLADPSCGYAGGSPTGRGVENTRQDSGYPFCGFFSKNNFFEKKFVRYAPP